MKRQLVRLVSLQISLVFLVSGLVAHPLYASGQYHALAPSTNPAGLLEVLKYRTMLEADGFEKDFAGLVALTAAEVSTPIRQILEDVYYSDTPKEISIINKLMDTFKSDDNVRAVQVLGEPELGFSQQKGKYKVVISQENFDLVKKSNLGIGTLIGIYDENNQLVGSFFFLNGPITTMIVADGKNHIAHYAHNGKVYGKRKDKLDLSKDNSTDDKSPAAIGGVQPDWPKPFVEFYKANKQVIPGAGTVKDKKTGATSPSPSLKTRYCGVEGAPAMAANMYEILCNNGFLAEEMSAEEARLWALFTRAAGGGASAMTPQGLKPATQISADRKPVQFYACNQGVLEKLIDSNLGKPVPEAVKIKTPKRASYKPSGYAAETFKEENTLESFLGGLFDATQPENHDLFGAITGVAGVAGQVPMMYVEGGKGTGALDEAGGEIKEIDEKTEPLFGDAVRPYVRECCSEEGNLNYNNGGGRYWTYLHDPLDGSSKVKSNGGGGTIGALVYTPDGQSHVGKSGRDIGASFFISYGVQTKMVLAVKGKGVHEFVLNKKDGKFYHVRQIKLGAPDKSKGLRIALGGSRSVWPAGFPGLVDKWNKAGAANGYSGAMVTDVYGALQHVLDGGAAAFAYLQRDKLRVKYEWAPIALILEEAGGDSLTHDFMKMEDPKAKNPPAINVGSILDRNYLLELYNEKKGKIDNQQSAGMIGDRQTVEEGRLSMVQGMPNIQSVMKKIREKENLLAGLVKDMAITEIPDDVIKRMETELDAHWIAPADYAPIKGAAGEYANEYAILEARHAKLQFDLMLALRQTADQRDADPIRKALKKILRYVNEGRLSAEVVEDTIASLWPRIMKAPVLHERGFIIHGYDLASAFAAVMDELNLSPHEKPRLGRRALHYTTLSTRPVVQPAPELQSAIAGVMSRLGVSVPENISDLDDIFLDHVLRNRYGNDPAKFGAELYAKVFGKSHPSVDVIRWYAGNSQEGRVLIPLENDSFLSFLRNPSLPQLRAVYDGIEQEHLNRWTAFAREHIQPNISKLRNHTMPTRPIVEAAEEQALLGTRLSQAEGGIGLSDAAWNKVLKIISDYSQGALTISINVTSLSHLRSHRSLLEYSYTLSILEGSL